MLDARDRKVSSTVLFAAAPRDASPQTLANFS